MIHIVLPVGERRGVWWWGGETREPGLDGCVWDDGGGGGGVSLKAVPTETVF